MARQKQVISILDGDTNTVLNRAANLSYILRETILHTKNKCLAAKGGTQMPFAAITNITMKITKTRMLMLPCSVLSEIT